MVRRAGREYSGRLTPDTEVSLEGARASRDLRRRPTSSRHREPPSRASASVLPRLTIYYEARLTPQVTTPWPPPQKRRGVGVLAPDLKEDGESVVLASLLAKSRP